ncbi:uncharacterized protein BDR25DRAFT_352495 [Lindgomyces ingoldianus]|uniref:Uncharacterized protein n=1 Tax=Lindgomyces ingoldianus TaxID=673940 RepID=A0ACB6R4M6_9PLEO|nr:uncharacterized protein BDR25DRAFT_352495 [Lindgomyces ingoldianus]KAF2474017.1 hypothetical protein BDR25DRAFT_352495 [Lindgomyces ingoldianus]
MPARAGKSKSTAQLGLRQNTTTSVHFCKKNPGGGKFRLKPKRVLFDGFQSFAARLDDALNGIRKLGLRKATNVQHKRVFRPTTKFNFKDY